MSQVTDVSICAFVDCIAFIDFVCTSYASTDTSALIRLKLASEYGYGNSPGTILTDKVNLLGSGAVPFWRWLEGSCRTPAGLGKIQVRFGVKFSSIKIVLNFLLTFDVHIKGQL
jgi:hypothetical protein